MNKQSSVDWLAEKIKKEAKNNFEFASPHTEIVICTSELIWIIEAAKAMHREEIEEAFISGDENSPFEKFNNSEDYYNQTFEK